MTDAVCVTYIAWTPSAQVRCGEVNCILLEIEFRKAQHRGHKESQRTTEKSPFHFSSITPLLPY